LYRKIVQLQYYYIIRVKLGNHLSILANAYITQYLAKKKYLYISYTWIGQLQDRPKRKCAAQDLQKCFPNLHVKLILDGGIYDPNCAIVVQLQKQWLSKRQQLLLNNASENGIDLLYCLLNSQQQHGIGPTKTATNNATLPNGKYNYSLPFLTANILYWKDVLDYTTKYVPYLLLMKTGCCSSLYQQILNPTSDIIYHHCNFNKELIPIGSVKKFGTTFHEVKPYTASQYLFAVCKTITLQHKS
jgi:hypothetical protein